jgi:MFS superfamily sulfate permease-like transporter
VNTDADLVALSAADAGRAVTGGFAVIGSPPRTAAGDSSGRWSQVLNIVLALVIGGVLLVATGLFDDVPSPVLDVIVLGIGFQLLKVGELRKVGRTRPVELYIALIALAVVAFVGVGQGVLIAGVFSLIDRACRQYRPSTETLLRDDEVGERVMACLGGFPPERLEGVVVHRFGASWCFARAMYFDDQVRALVGEASGPVRLLVIDADAMTEIDVTGAEVLAQWSTT